MNIVGYVRREERCFDELPFSDVDSLVLSQLTYADMRGIVPFDFACVPLAELIKVRCYENTVGRRADVKDNRDLIFALCSSRRFRRIMVSHYVWELDEGEEKQFSAVTFHLPDGSLYLAYRGTDDTIVGWKEDLNLTFKLIPSQIRALEYLVETASATTAPLMLGGHSKGGNVAVFAALSAPESVQERITAVYSHDGPGFREGVVGSDGYRRIAPKLHKTVPEYSVVGMALETGGAYTVVKAKGLGMVQHNPLFWQVGRDGSFIVKERVANGSKYVDRALKDWLNGISDEDRERFVDMLFSTLCESSATTLLGLRQRLPETIKSVGRAVIASTPEERHFAGVIIGALFSSMLKYRSPLPAQKKDGK